MLLHRPVTHVVFDMDGVLLDTERLYTEATQDIVGRFGRTFDWSIKANMIGRPARSARYLVETLALPITAEDYLREREVLFATLMPTAQAMPGARELTDALHTSAVPMAVATSSARAIYDLKTTRHRVWFAGFDVVLTGDDARIARGKPAPDIYLLAARELGVDPVCCVAVEDAPAGVEAARAAGMQVIAVPDPALDRGRLAGADVVLDTLVGLTLDDLGLGGVATSRGLRGIGWRTVPVPENVELTFPDDGGCFGCSPSNPNGLRMRFRRVGDRVVARHAIADRFHGAPGIAHGGIVATILDEVSCAVIAFVADRRVMTGELTVRYEHPCPTEAPLEISARITDRAHPRYWVVEGTVSHDGVAVARSSGKFFLRDDAPVAP